MGTAQTHIERKADTIVSLMLAPEQYQHLWCPSMTNFNKALILQLQGAQPVYMLQSCVSASFLPMSSKSCSASWLSWSSTDLLYAVNCWRCKAS